MSGLLGAAVRGLVAGGEDAFDGAVGGVADRDRAGTCRFQTRIAEGFAERQHPWALRSRWMALTAMNSEITSVQAGPTSAAARRHQVGLRRVKAIFSGG
jgi:hypothetical protein